MRIIITAFEPFGGHLKNSSYEGLKQLNDDSIVKVILPVAYPDAYEKLKDYIDDQSIVILLGMAAKRPMISIEERARNILSFRIPDNNGTIITDRKINEFADEYLYSPIDIDKLIKQLNQENKICYKSSDAGEYICNYLYFEVLNKHECPALFVHIPDFQTDEEYLLLNDFLKKIIIYFKGEEK